jgi:hypothetical protein
MGVRLRGPLLAAVLVPLPATSVARTSTASTRLTLLTLLPLLPLLLPLGS